MNVEISINNLAKCPIHNDFIRRVIRVSFAVLDEVQLKERGLEISVALIGKAEIQNINRIYRKKNSPTDVLSFPEFSGLSRIVAQSPSELFLGEIILCYDDIAEYSIKKKIGLKSEFARVLSHGTFHLLGLRHGKKMKALEDEAVGRLNLLSS